MKAVFIIASLVAAIHFATPYAQQWYQDYIDRSKTLSTGSTSQTDSSEYSYTERDNTPAESEYDDPSIPNLNSDEEYRKTIFGDYAEGQKFVLVGKVGQVMADGFVIHTKQLLSGNPFSLGDMIMSAANPLFLGGEIVVRFKGNPRILDGDIVQIKGRFQSVSQYEITLTKSKIKMPNFVGDYYDTTRSGDFFKKRKEAIDNENQIKQLSEEVKTKSDELQKIWTSLPNQLQNDLFKEHKAWVISHNASCRAIADTIDSLKCHIDGAVRRIDYLNSKNQKYMENKEADKTSNSGVSTDPLDKSSDPKNVQGIEYLVSPNVVYPESANGATGTAVIRALISVNGSVDEVTVQRKSGNSQLDRAALLAVKKAKFKPYRENGVAQEAYTLVPISYVLSNDDNFVSNKALSDKAVATDTQEKADKPKNAKAAADEKRHLTQSLGNDDAELGNLKSQVSANAKANSIDKYKAQIKSHIKSAWRVPDGSSGISATARFTLSSDGSIASVVITQSSGNDAFDTSVKALRSLSGVPVPDDSEVFSQVKSTSITFKAL